jgi:hypothetical protein
MGDTGLTGRKIIVDTYGGSCPHGGGAFSGKDPTKVDRSACYMARHVAKNIVAAGLAERAQVQVAYAIGVADPVSIMVETFGTGKVANAKLEAMIRRHFDFTPIGIIKYLDLRRPIYRKTAAGTSAAAAGVHLGAPEPGEDLRRHGPLAARSRAGVCAGGTLLLDPALTAPGGFDRDAPGGCAPRGPEVLRG